MKRSGLLCIAVLYSLHLCSQNKIPINAISTAVPVFSVTTDPALRGMGEIGAVSKESNTFAGLFINPALLSKNSMSSGIKIAFLPWHQNLISGINIYNIGVYTTLNKKHSLGADIFYLYDKGVSFLITPLLRDKGYQFRGSIKYAYRLSSHLSVGTSLKFFDIKSVPMGVYPQEINVSALAGDIGLDYGRYIFRKNTHSLSFNIGANLNNLGTKVSYFENAEKQFLPSAFSVGSMFTYARSFDSFKLEITPAFQLDRYIFREIDLFEAMFSFEDLIPGLTYKTGMEACFKEEHYSIALRGGFVSEDYSDQNIFYGTAGINFTYKIFCFDYAHIIQKKDMEMANTINVSIGFQKTLN